MAHTVRVVINAPLCFVFSKYNKIPNVQIVSTLTDYYSVKDITAAKNQLTDDVRSLQPNLTLTQLRSRRDADLHTRQHKEAADIIDIVSVLDQRGLSSRLPVYAVNNTDSIPTLKLEDGELKYFLSKMAKMEDAMLLLQGTVNKLYNCVYKGIQSHNTEELLQTLESPSVKPSYSTGQRPSFNTPACQTNNTVTLIQSNVHRQQASTPADDATVSDSDTVPRATAGVSNSHATITGANGVAHGARWADCYPTTSASSAVETDDAAEERHDSEFTLVENRRAKRRRVRRSPNNSVPPPEGQSTGQTRQAAAAAPGQSTAGNALSFAAAAKKPPRKPLMVGSLRSPPAVTTVQSAAAGTKRLTAAKPLLGKAVFCVDNVSNDVTADEVRQYAINLGVRVLECNETKPRRSHNDKINNVVPDHKAFFLCINKADSELLLDSSKWPADVSISAWFFRKKDDKQTTPSTPAAGTFSGTGATTSTTGAASAGVVPTNSNTGGPGADVAADTAATSVVVIADVHQIDTADIETAAEEMNLSPIHQLHNTGDHSDEFAEASDTVIVNDAHNSTSIHVVDLSSIVGNVSHNV